jgi:hypothetical protein
VTQVLRHKKDAEGLRRLLALEFRLQLKEREISYYRQGEFYDDLPVPGRDQAWEVLFLPRGVHGQECGFRNCG